MANNTLVGVGFFLWILGGLIMVLTWNAMVDVAYNWPSHSMSEIAQQTKITNTVSWISGLMIFFGFLMFMVGLKSKPTTTDIQPTINETNISINKCKFCGEELATSTANYCVMCGDKQASELTKEELLKSAMKALDAGDKELAKKFMNQADTFQVKKPPLQTIEIESEQTGSSNYWYILPILLGIPGGIIGYFVLRKTNRHVAWNLIIVGAIITLVLFVGIVGILNYSMVQEPSSTEEPSPIEYSFSGVGDKSTYTFYIPTREWVMAYEATADFDEAEYASLTIIVYPEGESARYTDWIDFNGVGKDYTIVHHGPGKYYLRIISANCKWEINIAAQP